jgi:hypothetical protein
MRKPTLRLKMMIWKWIEGNRLCLYVKLEIHFVRDETFQRLDMD